MAVTRPCSRSFCRGVTSTQLERVTAPRRRLAGVEGDRRRAGVAVRRRQRDGDHDHAEVHDHAAVGPPDQPAPALAPRRQHDLAQRRPGGEPGEAEGDERRPARRRRRARRARASRRRTTPARTAGPAAAPRWPCATAAPGRPPSGTAARCPIGIVSRSKYGGPTTVWRSCSASTSSGNTVPSSTTNANTANSTLLARNAPSRDSGESIAPGERRRSPRQPISTSDDGDDDPEEREQVGADRPVAEGVHAVEHARSG